MDAESWVRAAEERLRLAGAESPRLEAQMLAAHVLGVERAAVLARPDAEVPDLAAEALLQRREGSEPLAYILGWREFYGRRFAVRPGVLIPRQESETVLDTALSLPASRVLDLGTGSGILAITLALERPEWEVWASDISTTALAIARENAEALQAPVHFVESDAFAAVAGERFDLIVTNPPYVASGAPLPAEIAHHEPGVALYAGVTGLEFFERLADEATDHLAEGGRLATEVGDAMAGPTATVFESGGWVVERRVKDLLGIDRCLVLAPPHGLS